MISDVGSVAVLVMDPQKAAEWYHDKLGFEIVGNEGHSVFIRAKGSNSLLLHLCGRCDDWQNDLPGGRTGIWFSCGEIRLCGEDTGRVFPSSQPAAVERTYYELKDKGVEFSLELATTAWGKMAIFKDPDGNEFEIS